jgi:hypothetical protein
VELEADAAVVPAARAAFGVVPDGGAADDRHEPGAQVGDGDLEVDGTGSGGHVDEGLHVLRERGRLEAALARRAAGGDEPAQAEVGAAGHGLRPDDALEGGQPDASRTLPGAPERGLHGEGVGRVGGDLGAADGRHDLVLAHRAQRRVGTERAEG